MYKGRKQMTRKKRTVVTITTIITALLLAGGALFVLPQRSARAASTLYVKQGGATTGNCDNWTNACELSYALKDKAASGDEIWVAKGTYKPGAATTDSFNLKSGVAIYGGFEGDETNLNDRDWQTNTTILSGDIDGSTDVYQTANPFVTSNSGNSKIVVTASGVDNTAILDGFIIQGGNNPDTTKGGGGIFNDGGSPTLNNLTIQYNWAVKGAGMYNTGANAKPKLSNVTFKYNLAFTDATAKGGGMFNANSSAPELQNVTFDTNYSAWVGGGMANNASSPKLTNVTFKNNNALGTGSGADGYGGGMYNENASNPTLNNVTFTSNTAERYGGGMANNASSPTLTNVTFTSNTAERYGGGMANEGGSSPTLDYVEFNSNQTTTDATNTYGGGLYNEGANSNPMLRNVQFINNRTATNDNHAHGQGGGMYSTGSNKPTLIGVTFQGNKSQAHGGGLVSNSSSTVRIVNAVFDGNSATHTASGDGSGGGMSCTSSGYFLLVNSVFKNNTAKTRGGGLYLNGLGSLYNITVYGNDSDGSGGGIYNNNVTRTMYNSIIWGNTDNSSTVLQDKQIAFFGGGTVDLSNSILQDRDSSSTRISGSNIITEAPLFVDATNGNLHLKIGSPGIDSGDNTKLPKDAQTNNKDIDQDGDETEYIIDNEDLDGNPRINGTVDRGAYEFVNVAPVAVADTYTTPANASLTMSVSNNDTDDNTNAGDIIEVSSISTTGTKGAVAISIDKKNIIYTPTNVADFGKMGAGQSAVDTFTYNIKDSFGSTSVMTTVTITVNGVADAPVITQGESTTLTVNEDASQTITLNATDPDGDEITWSISSNATHGTASVSANPTGASQTITYDKLETNYKGPDSFKVKVTSAGGLSDEITVNVTVNPIADAPSVTPAETQETVKSTSGLVISRNSADGAEVTHFKITSITNGKLYQNDGSNEISNGAFITYAQGQEGLKFQPNAGATSGSFQVQAALSNSDAGAGISTPTTANITVTPLDTAPSFTKGADQTALEDSGKNTVTGWATNISKGKTHESGQTLTFAVTTNNDSLFATDGKPQIAANGTLTFTPADNANGEATITIVLSDNGRGDAPNTNTAAPVTFKITITPVNDAPTFAKGTGWVDQLEVNEDSSAHAKASWVKDLSAGPENEESQENDLSFTVTTDKPGLFNGDVTLGKDGNLTFTPAENAFGEATVTIVLKDKGGTANGGKDTSTAQTFKLVVKNVADLPSIAAPAAVGDTTNPIQKNEDVIFGSLLKREIVASDPDVVSDSDTSVFQLMLTASKGKLKLGSTTTELTFLLGTNGWGGETTIACKGTLANINKALEGMKFTANADACGTGSIQVKVTDPENTSAEKNITMNLVACSGTENQAPVNSVPRQQTIDANTNLVFSTAKSNAIAISDADAGTNPVKVTLSATNGTLTLAKTDVVNVTSNTGAEIIFTGTIANINIALDGLTFKPTKDYVGNASITITTNDQGYTGVGGAQTDSESITIVMKVPVNDPPINDVPGQQLIKVSTSLTLSSNKNNNIKISDPDAGTNAISVTLSATKGTLTLAKTDGLSFSPGVGDGKDDTTMTFTGIYTNINTALDGMTFTPPTGYTGMITVTITTNDQGHSGDGGPKTDKDEFSINVSNEIPLNLAPVNTVPRQQTVQKNTNLVFSTASSNAISISDPDAGTNRVKVTLTASNGTLTLATTNGLDFSAGGVGNGIEDTIMTFTGSIANINAALNGLTFKPTKDYVGNAEVKITTNDLGNTGDGGEKTVENSFTIVVSELVQNNQAPVNTVPGQQIVLVNTTVTFSTANGKAITISDPDAGENPVKVTLTASNGKLTLATINGLTFASGTGTNDTTMTFTGSIANINIALNGLIFTPNTGYTGNAEVTITTNDQGHSGAGGEKTHEARVTISVVDKLPPNQAPVNTVPGQQTTQKNTDLVFSTANGNGVSISDPDAYTNPVKVTLTASNGTLTLATINGLTFASGTGTNDTTMTFTGSIANINIALAGLTFTPNTGYTGNAEVKITTNDLGNTGDGGEKTVEDSIAIVVSQSVIPNNKPPTAWTLEPKTVNENKPEGTVVGYLKTDDPDNALGDKHTYSLVDTENYPDNAAFLIDGDKLKTNRVFDREVQDWYSIKLRTTDSGGLFYEEIMIIYINDVADAENHAPTSMSLDNNTVKRGQPVGSTVGNLSTVDADPNDTHTYKLLQGGEVFAINNNSLITTVAFGDDAAASYTIRVEVGDGRGGYYEQEFTIEVKSNTIPTVSSFEQWVKRDTRFLFEASHFEGHFADADGDSLAKVKIATLPSTGTLMLSGTQHISVTVGRELAPSEIGLLYYEPKPNHTGDTSFTWNGSDVLAYASKPATVTLHIRSALPPTVQPFDITVSKNNPYTFNAEQFAATFTAHEQNPDDKLTAIKITTAPKKGTLTLDAAYVKQGDEIPVSDLDLLTYTPDKGYTGTDSFGWNGKGNLVYADQDTVVHLTMVNEPPMVFEVVKNYETFTNTVSFAVEDFDNANSFYDPNNDTLTDIMIQTLPASGTLKLHGTAIISPSTYIAFEDLSRLTYEVSAVYTDTGGVDWVDTFAWNGNDGEVYAKEDGQVLIVMGNKRPIVTDIISRTDVNVPISITLSSFQKHFTDPDGDTLHKIKITQLPMSGTLTLNGKEVTYGQTILASAIHNLVYQPNQGHVGKDIIGWNGNDGKAYAKQGAVISITAGNHLPVLADFKVGTKINTPFEFTPQHFESHFQDQDGDQLNTILISSLPPSGTLRIGGEDVNEWIDTLTFDDLATDKLTYLPNPDFLGIDTFEWLASDYKGYAKQSAVVTVTVSSEPPSITHIFTTTTVNTPITFTQQTFAAHFSDSIGVGLQAIQISSVPLQGGKLFLYGEEIVIQRGDEPKEIAAADIAGLSYVPAPDYQGADGFYWNASDGALFAEENAMVEIKIGNNPPVVSNFSKDTLIGKDLTFSADDFHAVFNDADDFDVDEYSDKLTEIKIVSLPVSGTLKLGSVAVSAGQVIPVADIGNLVYTPVAVGAFSFMWNGSDGLVYAEKDAQVTLNVLYDEPILTITVDIRGELKPGNVVQIVMVGKNSGGVAAKNVAITTVTPDKTTYNEEGSTPGWQLLEQASLSATAPLTYTYSVGTLEAGKSTTEIIFAVKINDSAQTGDILNARATIAGEGVNAEDEDTATIAAPMPAIYLPLIMRSTSAPPAQVTPTPGGPTATPGPTSTPTGPTPTPGPTATPTPTPIPGADIVVTSFEVQPENPISGEAAQVTIVVKNQGSELLARDFWVDLYISPNPAPTTAGYTWNTVCGVKPCHGISWLVDPLGPGASATLTSNVGSYDGQFTRWDGGFKVAGTLNLYVYADNWNGAGVENGAVSETNEQNNRAHKQITVGGTTIPSLSAEDDILLPPRPLPGTGYKP